MYWSHATEKIFLSINYTSPQQIFSYLLVNRISKNFYNFCTTRDQTSHAITLNKNLYTIYEYNIGILTYRTNIGLRHFIYQTLKCSGSTYLPIRNGKEVKFWTIKTDNMYLQRIRVKFSDWYVSLRITIKKQITSEEFRCI